VGIYKRNAENTSWGYVRKVALQGFTPDSIPERWGGGRYMLRCINARNKIAKTITIEFPTEIYPFTPAPAPAAGPAAGAAAAPAPDSMINFLLQLSQQRERDRESQDKFLQTLVLALAGKQQSAGPTLTELVNSVAALKSLSGAEASPTPVNVVMDAMRAALEMRDQVGEREEGESSPMYRLLEKVIPPIMEAASKAAPPRNPAAAFPAGKNPPLAAVAGNGGANPPDAEIPEELKPYLWLRKYLPALVGWAHSGFNPDRAASVINGLIPPEQEPMLDMILDMEPGARHSLFVQLEPRLQPFRMYLDEICSQLAGDSEDDLADSPDSAAPAPAH
jgi:hypothetical protein